MKGLISLKINTALSSLIHALLKACNHVHIMSVIPMTIPNAKPIG